MKTTGWSWRAPWITQRLQRSWRKWATAPSGGQNPVITRATRKRFAHPFSEKVIFFLRKRQRCFSHLYKTIIYHFLQFWNEFHCISLLKFGLNQYVWEEGKFWYIYTKLFPLQILKDDEDVTIIIMHGRNQRPESSTLTIPRMTNMWEGRYSCHVWCATLMETGTITLTITPGETCYVTFCSL